MLSEEQHILIDKFFSGELTAEELQAFQSLLRDDVMFRSEVELQQQVIQGIAAYGEAQLKAELKEIHEEVKRDLNNYKPGNAGAGLASAIKWLLILGAVGTAGYYGYNYYVTHKQEIHEQLKQIEEEQPAGQESTRRDTVWHTIKSVSRKDTVIYGDDAMREYMKGQPGAAQPAMPPASAIQEIRDTIVRQ